MLGRNIGELEARVQKLEQLVVALDVAVLALDNGDIDRLINVLKEQGAAAIAAGGSHSHN